MRDLRHEKRGMMQEDGVVVSNVTIPAEQLEQFSMAMVALVAIIRNVGGKLVVPMNDLQPRDDEQSINFRVTDDGQSLSVTLVSGEPFSEDVAAEEEE